MTERHEEQAALHALHVLDAHESRILQSEMRTDPRLRELADDLEISAADIAHLLPEEPPPDDMRRRILAEVKQRRRSNMSLFALPLKIVTSPWVAWAVASCVAVMAFKYRHERADLLSQNATLKQGELGALAESVKARDEAAGLNRQLADAKAKSADLAGEIDKLLQVNALARMEAASLHAQLKRFDEAVAVVVWDVEKHEGKLKLEKMPPVQANKDYQLWVIDKKNPNPVSAGVVKVDTNGIATVNFKPTEPVTTAAKFAVSIEVKGGVAKKSPDGPIIFVGP